MKIISLFNNKGGVGKTTLGFHLSHALEQMGHKTLIIDLDPQCNISILSVKEDILHEIWEKEDSIVENGFGNLLQDDSKTKDELFSTPRSIHFILKPTVDGESPIEELPPPIQLGNNLGLIPGRLTVYKYEQVISERWSGLYQGNSLSIRTVTDIRDIAERYANQYGYEFIIIDTSPSLGALNKVIISTVDGFIIPAFPDIFSLYGIRNIGDSLKSWKREFDIIYSLLSEEKRNKFPSEFVKFLGYTIYNAKKNSKGSKNKILAKAHHNYSSKIPETISKFISHNVENLPQEVINDPIGGDSILKTHNTFPAMSQKYHCPMWDVPSCEELDEEDKSTIMGNRAKYEETKQAYIDFASALIERLSNKGTYGHE